MADEKTKINWFWPKIFDMATAKQAAKSGFWAATIVAVVTTIVATISLISQKDILSVNAWAYVDAVLFAVIAWRIKRYSRAFAIVGVVLFVIEKALLASTQGTTGWVVALALLLMFINGARGVFAYHKFSSPAANDPIS